MPDESAEKYARLLETGWSMVHLRATGQDMVVRASTAKALFGTGVISSMSYPCETIEEATKDTAGQCKECGGLVGTRYVEPVAKALRESGTCHSCHHWTEIISSNRSNRAIIDGTIYSILPDEPNGHKGFLGFGGSRFEIEFKDGRTVVSHNLWYGGEIPHHFKHRLPDTARFIVREDVVCNICKQAFHLIMNSKGYREWKSGKKHIQAAMPELEEREILISGNCNKCFDKLFERQCDGCGNDVPESAELPKKCSNCGNKYCDECFGDKKESTCQGCNELSRERYY